MKNEEPHPPPFSSPHNHAQIHALEIHAFKQKILILDFERVNFDRAAWYVGR